MEKEQWNEELFIKLFNSAMSDFRRETTNAVNVINSHIDYRSDRLEEKADNLGKQIQSMSEQIGSYQSLLEHQIEIAVSEEEVERIIHSYSDVATERIIKRIDGKYSQEDYNIEKNKLIDTFKASAWKKLDESSKSFLISSKVMYKKLEAIGDIVDYSGVCLLVTKALEVEMKKRFRTSFIAFLKNRYGDDYKQYPMGLLDRDQLRRGNYRLLNEHGFTFGTVAYVLCCYSHTENDKQKLLEFCKCVCMPDLNENDAFSLLQKYGAEIERIRKDYRNPTAHTAQLNMIKAKECMDLVIDVEKLVQSLNLCDDTFRT